MQSMCKTNRSRFHILQSKSKVLIPFNDTKRRTTTTSSNIHSHPIVLLLILIFQFSSTNCCCAVTAFTTSFIANYSLSKVPQAGKTVTYQSSLFSSVVEDDPIATTTMALSSSSSSSTSTSPLVFPDDLLETLTNTANSYSAAHGIQVETKVLVDATTTATTTTTASTTTTKKTYQMAPMSLLPQAYPRYAFQNAITLAPYFNQLVQYISQDSTFLMNTLGGIISQQDSYTAKLLQLYIKIYYPTTTDVGTSTERQVMITKWAHSADQLGIIRSDYMLHRNNNDNDAVYNIKQVELNTIASSFAGLAHKVAQLHNYLIQRYTSNEESALNHFLRNNQKAMVESTTTTTTTTVKDDDTVAEPPGVPFNPTLERLPYAMNLTVQRYKERFLKGSTIDRLQCGILFVVQDGETNTVDQRLLEFQLWDIHKIPIVRLSLSQIYTKVQRDTTTGALSVALDGTATMMEIALVYYRAGYAPTDYPSGYDVNDGIEWLAREMMEGSRATKCPSLGYHLAGTKKVQQELSRPGRLEQYFPNEPNVVVQMRQAFAGLYSLGDDANDSDIQAVQDIVINKNHPKYVLKPQREGGGYNFYGEQMLQKLQENVTITQASTVEDSSPTTITLSESLGEYILMERLFPPQQDAILLRGGNVEGIGKSISELGCFGTILVAGHDDNVVDSEKNTKDKHHHQMIHNEYAGFLLRTKFSNVDEGGVASGFATLSSPYLF